LAVDFSNALIVPLLSIAPQVNIFTEEMIRAGSAASLSMLLNRLDPVLRKTANLGRLILLFLGNLFAYLIAFANCMFPEAATAILDEDRQKKVVFFPL